jgi:hypothetical protein
LIPEIALLAWFPIVFLIFNSNKNNPVRAISIALLFGWLFLPQYSVNYAGPIDLSKEFSIYTAPCIASLFFFPVQMRSFRWHNADCIIVLSILLPFISALSNDLGVYDGLAGVKGNLFFVFIPYYLGRVFLHSSDDLIELCRILFIGTLVYIPLCWFEIRFSPQLHNMVYGYSQHSFLQTLRGNGYRPMVFLYHGLSLGLLFAVASSIAFVLWRTRTFVKMGNYPFSWALISILVTAIAIKSTNAILLIIVAIGLSLALAKQKSPKLLIAIYIIALGYPYLKIQGLIPEATIVNTISSYISEDRAGSVQFRFNNELMLTDKALQRPLFGWGGWGRSRVYDEWGNDISITDSLWIMIFGTNGYFGLILFSLLQVLPLYFLVKKIPASEWLTSKNAPFFSLVMGTLLILVNNYFNADTIPLFKLFVGSVPLLQTALSTSFDRGKSDLLQDPNLLNQGTRFI